MASLFPLRPSPHDCEWIGSRYVLPASVRDGNAVIHPEVDIWLELPSELLVGSQIVDPRENVPFGDSLRAAIEHPLEEAARRPARIRVPNERLAESIRGVAAGTAVVVAPVPELDEAFEELSSSFAAFSPYATYLKGGAIPPAVVAALFSAAAKLFRAAPWRHVSETHFVRVDIPAAGVEGACISIIGAAGESFGLLLFRSLGAFEAFASGGRSPEDLDDTTEPPIPSVLSVSFDRKKDLAPEMVEEIERHRWEVAGAKGYPVVLALDTDREPQPATERDYRILTACTLAFVDFFARHRDLFHQDFPELTSETFEGDDGMTVTLTAPYGEDIFPEEPFFEPADAPPPRARVGRNDPCPCGSGKKYKKCHLGAENGP